MDYAQGLKLYHFYEDRRGVFSNIHMSAAACLTDSLVAPSSVFHRCLHVWNKST